MEFFLIKKYIEYKNPPNSSSMVLAFDNAQFIEAIELKMVDKRKTTEPNKDLPELGEYICTYSSNINLEGSWILLKYDIYKVKITKKR